MKEIVRLSFLIAAITLSPFPTSVAYGFEREEPGKITVITYDQCLLQEATIYLSHGLKESKSDGVALPERLNLNKTNSVLAERVDLQKAAKAADDIANSIHAMIVLKRALGEQQKITRDEELALTYKLLEVNSADKDLVKKFEHLKAPLNAATRATLAKLIATLRTAIKDLDVNGVKKIADSDARQKLARILDDMNGSAQVLQDFVEPS